MFVIR
jgi:hypothetical protein